MAKSYGECEVAQIYWSLAPRKRKWREVASILGHTPEEADNPVLQNRLGRFARRWEELGFVSHQVRSEEDSDGAAHWTRSQADTLLPSRSTKLENQLRRRFCLREVIVI